MHFLRKGSRSCRFRVLIEELSDTRLRNRDIARDLAIAEFGGGDE